MKNKKKASKPIATEEVNIDQVPQGAIVKRPSWLLADQQGEWLFPPSTVSPEEVEPEAKEKEAAKEESASPSDDLYASFARRVSQIPRLTEEDERLLGLRVRDHHDKRASKKLVLHNMRLALKMAFQYRRSWTSLMDLVQEASTGMAIAAERWDPDKGTRYGTYAAYWIRAQLTKFLMTNARLIHTGNTRAGRKVYFSLPEIRRQLLAKGQEPTVERIAEAVGEDPQEVALIVSRLQGREASLSTPMDEESAITLQDTLSSDIETPETYVVQNEIQTVIHDLIGKFEATIANERDMAIWKEHLIASEPKSLVELGERYGVSKQRMGQLATRIKRAFRRHIIDELGPHTQLSWLFHRD